MKSKLCKARAVTALGANGELVVLEGPKKSPHAHALNVQEFQADVIKHSLKRKAQEHPGLPPGQLLRTELQNVRYINLHCFHRSDRFFLISKVPGVVLNELPERNNLKKATRTRHCAELSTNPQTLDDVYETQKHSVATNS